MTNFFEPAIVLQTAAFNDADLIVTFLGKNLGKVSAVALRARSSKKRFAGGLDLFDCGEFELLPPRKQHAMYKLLSITKKEIWPQLRHTMSKLSLACLCLEITNSFTVIGDPEAGSILFTPLFLTLRKLSASFSDNECEALAAYFTLYVLKASGYNLLDSGYYLGSVTIQWFQQMLAACAPIVPANSALTRQGLNQTLSFCEQVLEHPLKARKLWQPANL